MRTARLWLIATLFTTVCIVSLSHVAFSANTLTEQRSAAASTINAHSEESWSDWMSVQIHGGSDLYRMYLVNVTGTACEQITLDVRTNKNAETVHSLVYRGSVKGLTGEENGIRFDSARPSNVMVVYQRARYVGPTPAASRGSECEWDHVFTARDHRKTTKSETGDNTRLY